jgi:glycosylphosphatidylinositol transamidase (GPIT) subunit GPI8
MKALIGDEVQAAKGMKVLKSGSKSKIFVYLSNLGATGLLAFPNFDLMYADELIKVFKTM